MSSSVGDPNERAASQSIRRRGSPEEHPGDLAHYYRFVEIYNGRKLIKVDDCWQYAGDPVPFPDVWPMARVPAGGFKQPDVTPAVWDLLRTFDESFTLMVGRLEDAWTRGDSGILGESVGTMFGLIEPAIELMKTPIPGGSGTYGPCFRLLT